MKKYMLAVLGLVLLLAACQSRPAQITISDPWARPAGAGENSAAFFVIVNGTSEEDAVIQAKSDVAEAVEIHLSKMDENGVMQMIRQKRVVIPAGSETAFKPGHYHVMLIGLRRELKEGDTFTLTLFFEKHAPQTFTVSVEQR
jgi:copper(I)-binding protein